MKHVHAEVIHAFADGALVQVRTPGSEHWANTVYPDFDKKLEYRIKPEPAAPKWPQTTMTGADLDDWFQSTRLTPSQIEVIMDGVNKAIAKECQSGALVPADKVREIEAKARADEARKSMNPVAVIDAAWRHMKLGRLDPETIQIILLQAAK